MRSGLRHQEMADPIYTSGEVRMMFLDGRDDMAAWAEAAPLEHEAGRVFQYSTPTAMILSDIAARILAPDGSADERRAAVDEFMVSRLSGPLRAPSLRGEYDASGTMLGGSMIWATARDWAKVRRIDAAQGLGARHPARPAQLGRVHDPAEPAQGRLRRDDLAQPQVGQREGRAVPRPGTRRRRSRWSGISDST